MEERSLVHIKVIPKAKRKSIELIEGGYKFKLLSPPEDGKANKELLEWIKQIFHKRGVSIALIKGESSRNKVIEVHGIGQKECDTLLRSYCSSYLQK